TLKLPSNCRLRKGRFSSTTIYLVVVFAKILVYIDPWTEGIIGQKYLTLVQQPNGSIKYEKS
ncbi:MAG: hypothetical protein WCR72_17915, partial [Bacteroidota bacterium]